MVLVSREWIKYLHLANCQRKVERIGMQTPSANQESCDFDNEWFFNHMNKKNVGLVMDAEGRRQGKNISG